MQVPPCRLSSELRKTARESRSFVIKSHSSSQDKKLKGKKANSPVEIMFIRAWETPGELFQEGSSEPTSEKKDRASVD